MNATLGELEPSACLGEASSRAVEMPNDQISGSHSAQVWGFKQWLN